jgi:hypothetical protein
MNRIRQKATKNSGEIGLDLEGWGLYNKCIKNNKNKKSQIQSKSRIREAYQKGILLEK